MCIKHFLQKISGFAGIFGLFVAIIVISIPIYAKAQSKTSANKLKAKKTTRVFYGQASYYSNKFNGRRTASGEIFSQKKLTCACNVLPIGTWIKVTNLKNGKSVIVKINDRIHPRMKRITDLSSAAAARLGYLNRGVTRVKVELIDKKFIAQ